MTNSHPYAELPLDFDAIDDSLVDISQLKSSAASSSKSLNLIQHEGASNASALFHIVCVIAGTGVLQLPFTLKQSGWMGIIIMFLSAIINEYTGRLLIQCLYYKGQRIASYPDIGYSSFGPWGRAIVNVFYNLVLLGVACLYLILAGRNLEILSMSMLSKRVWYVLVSCMKYLVKRIFLCGVCIWFPFILLRTLKEVSIVSLLGAIASVVLVVVICIMSIVDAPSHRNETHQLIRFDTMASAIASVAFSFGGNFVYPEVEHSMKHPQEFPLVLKKSMWIISIMYFMSTVAAYATFGDACKSPILESLSPGFMTTFGTIIVTLHVLLACPVLVTTFSLEMERHLQLDDPIDSSRQKFSRILLRTCIIIGVSFVAMMIPFFDDFMTLIGALSNTMLIFVFPIVFHYKLFGTENVPLYEHVARIFIVSIGVFAGCVGGTEAIVQLYKDFRAGA